MKQLDDWLAMGIPEPIVNDAVEWIVKLDGEPDAALQTEFMQWLDQDLLHRWAFEELSALWARQIVVAKGVSSVTEMVRPKEPEPVGPKWWQSVTAMLCLVVGVSAVLMADGPQINDFTPAPNYLYVSE